MSLSKKYKEAKDVAYYLEERYHEIKVHGNTFSLMVKNFATLYYVLIRIIRSVSYRNYPNTICIYWNLYMSEICYKYKAILTWSSLTF